MRKLRVFFQYLYLSMAALVIVFAFMPNVDWPIRLALFTEGFALLFIARVLSKQKVLV